MSDHTCPLRVGDQVPEFEIRAYDPRSEDFTTFSLAEAKRAGKWTILFFYPADFTFV